MWAFPGLCTTVVAAAASGASPMAAADAAMANGATYRSFIFSPYYLGGIASRRCRLKIGFRLAYSAQLVQAWGQPTPPVCVLATRPEGVPEFHIAGPYATSGSRPPGSSRSASGRTHW